MNSDFAVIKRHDSKISAPFEGSKGEVLLWLQNQHWSGLYEVYNRADKTYSNARDFILKCQAETMSPEQKLRHEDLNDPVVRARNEMVRQLIERALRSANESDCDLEFLVGSTTYEIIRLFY